MAIDGEKVIQELVVPELRELKLGIKTDQSPIWWSQSTLVLFGAVPHDPGCLTHAS